MGSEHTWNDWYSKNKDALNHSRRKAYHESPQHSSAVRGAARKYREERKNGRKIERKYTRQLDGVTVQVFGSMHVAEKLGITAQTIVTWERKGLIPKSVFPDAHRMYTAKQVKLIGALVKLFDGVPSRKRSTLKGLPKTVKRIHDQWR